MSSLRGRQLAEGIKNKLIAIQKSKQIYEKLSKWERRSLLMDDREIERVANSIAAKVEKYAARMEKNAGNQPTPQQVMAKIKEELDKI
ncbi:MAG: hypothetical protein COZ93_08200 [Nitrospirae bacterium CG_4_8_14_3_um_filter_44_28]|nr:MAG: hypothetical protein COZ93_08200 [Nitrospirae bacterium CG_4_8_14_3_um_filter_44_28]